MISGYRDSGIKSETRENSGGFQYQYGYPCTGIDRAVGVVHTHKKLALAKMEEEEGEQDLARARLRRVILVLLMHLSRASIWGLVGLLDRGGSGGCPPGFLAPQAKFFRDLRLKFARPLARPPTPATTWDLHHLLDH